MKNARRYEVTIILAIPQSDDKEQEAQNENIMSADIDYINNEFGWATQSFDTFDIISIEEI